MELLDYLYQHGLSEAQLLDALGIGHEQLLALEGMPQPSYRLQLQLACDSVFGPHTASGTLAIYARGYVEWARLLMAGADGRALFYARYRARLQTLGGAALDTPAHLEQEWQHFLAGTYGLCTRTGLPEDIADKEWAIHSLQALTSTDVPEAAAYRRLLDAASAGFAPHERARSSRARWLEQ